MHVTWRGITMSHTDFILFQWDIHRNKIIGHLASDSAFSWILEVLWDEGCLINVYGADCQVHLISSECRDTRKFLGTSCEFFIFLLDLCSKQVRLIKSLFCCMLARSNLQRLKSAEMEKHFYFSLSEKEIGRERSQSKILNSGI